MTPAGGHVPEPCGPGPGPALTCGSAAAAGAGAGGAGGANGSCPAGTSGAEAWGEQESSGRDAGSGGEAGKATGTAPTSGSAGGIRGLEGAAAAKGAGRGEPRKRHGTPRPGTSSARLCPAAAWGSPRAAGSPPAPTHGQTGWGTFGRPGGAEGTPGVSRGGEKDLGWPARGTESRVPEPRGEKGGDKAQEGALPGLLRAAGLSAGV